MKVTKFWKKTLLTIINLSIFCAPILQIFPYLIKPVEAEWNGWCPEAPEGLSMICGTVTSAREEIDLETGISKNNIAKSGITVAIYEKNQISSTGQIYGQLTNLFSSTETNENGQYAIPVRKMGAPDSTSFLVFLCGGKVMGMKEINTFVDQTGINAQIDGCIGPQEYKSPAVPLTYTSRGVMYSCENNVSGEDITYTNEDARNAGLGLLEYLPNDENGNPFEITEEASIPIGLEGNIQPTINNHVREDNYDPRHVSNDYVVDGISGLFNLEGTFTTAGGLREEDCKLQLIENGHEEEEASYLCNMQDEDGNYLMSQANRSDYLTRNWLAFIPKGDEQPYRKLEFRVNTTAALMDPKAGKQASDVLVGGGGAGDTKVRLAGQDYEMYQDSLPDCRTFLDANNPGVGGNVTGTDKQQAAGQGGLYSPVKMEAVFEEASVTTNLEEPFCVHPDFVFEGITMKKEMM